MLKTFLNLIVYFPITDFDLQAKGKSPLTSQELFAVFFEKGGTADIFLGNRDYLNFANCLITLNELFQIIQASTEVKILVV